MPKPNKRNLTNGVWMSVWVEADLKEWVRVDAAKQGQSISQYVREAMEKMRYEQRR